MADENEVKALADRLYDAAVSNAGSPSISVWETAQHAAREALLWRDETRPLQPAAAVPDAAALAQRLDKTLGCHADSMPKEAYFEVDAVMRALQAQQPAAAVPNRLPDIDPTEDQRAADYHNGWNDCREAMLAAIAAIKGETP